MAPGWDKIIGDNTSAEEAYSVRQTTDGGYIIAGFQTPSGGLPNAYLTKTDINGEIQAGWPKIYGGSNADEARCVRQTSDGGYIIVGYTRSFGAGNADVYLIKTNASGVIQAGWPKTFGGMGEDIGHAVEQTPDGGYIIVGETSSFGGGNSDVYLIKTDTSGNCPKASNPDHEDAVPSW